MNAAVPDSPTPVLSILPSRQLPSWLAEQGLSLAVSTYQSGKLFLLGVQEDQRLSVFERTFNRAMGLCAQGDQLYLSTLFQLWRFDDVLPEGALHDGYDRLYVPQLAWTTGDLDIHDIAVMGDGRIAFVNTLFSCLGTPDVATSFRPLWKPDFISRLAAEDRCHLNGMALVDGKPGFVTAVARSDVADGWREGRRDGGVVIEIATGEVVRAGFSMPHSPRWHDAGDGPALYLLDSGNGWFGRLDVESGRFDRIAFCPGYARGLAFHGHYAVIGLSRPRGSGTFSGLALDDALAEKGTQARCGLLVVDLRTGDTVHWLRFEGIVEELYDVVALPGTRRPMALGLKTDEIRRVITVGEDDSIG